jgi:hypothetical protein
LNSFHAYLDLNLADDLIYGRSSNRGICGGERKAKFLPFE